MFAMDKHSSDSSDPLLQTQNFIPCNEEYPFDGKRNAGLWRSNKWAVGTFLVLAIYTAAATSVILFGSMFKRESQSVPYCEYSSTSL